MPINWVNRRILTNDTEIEDADGNVIHNLYSCEQGASVEIDRNINPVLWERVGGKNGDRDYSKCLHNYVFQQQPLGTGELTSLNGYTKLRCYSGAEVIEENGEQFARLTNTGAYHTPGGQGAMQTIECIMRVNDLQTSKRMFLSFSHQADTASYNYASYRSLLIEGDKLFAYQHLYGQSGAYFDTGFRIKTGEWNHFSFTWDANNAYVHANGVKMITLAGGITGEQSACFFALGTYYPDRWKGLACDILGARASTSMLYGEDDYEMLGTPYNGKETIGYLPNMTRPVDSPIGYKVIGDYMEPEEVVEIPEPFEELDNFFDQLGDEKELQDNEVKSLSDYADVDYVKSEKDTNDEIEQAVLVDDSEKDIWGEFQ